MKLHPPNTLQKASQDASPDASPDASQDLMQLSSGALCLDHLVYGVPDLKEGVQDFARRAGIEPARGGQHEGLGTANYLVRLGARSYLEIIGPDPAAPEPAGPRPFGVDDLGGPRLLGWAVQTTDLKGVVEASQGRGYDPGPVGDMSRQKPDGSWLRWRLAVPKGGQLAYGGLVPFVIDWGESVHPSASLEAGLKLNHLQAEHPENDQVAKVLSALGVPLEVGVAERPRLRAILETPLGELTLE